MLHVGKAVPIIHSWGSIKIYKGENQYTGEPWGTFNEDNIALISPEALTERIENIRRMIKRYHAVGIREITPYICYFTLAGDHQRRLGFWKFYDNWETYSKWAGPKLPNDPFDWMIVDKRGRFARGMTGGCPYSPDYFAPLHRYNVCANHPDWIEWHRRLIRMIAEVGYDGYFVDNGFKTLCYCRYCRSLFRSFLDENRNVNWVRFLTKGLDIDKLNLDSLNVPTELIRRWKMIRTGDHLGMLRKVGRKVNSDFTVFVNSGDINGCLVRGGKCDRLMFESSSSPGIFGISDSTTTDEIAIKISTEPVEPKRFTSHYELEDRATWTATSLSMYELSTRKVKFS